MENNLLNRINELAKISKERDLSEEEKTEQKSLRTEYIASYKQNLRGQLESMVIIDKDGNRINVKDLKRE